MPGPSSRSSWRTSLHRRWSVAAAAACLLAVSVAPGVSARQTAVTFSAQPGVAPLVAHYTVSAADRSGSSANASNSQAGSSDEFPELAPKDFPRAAGARVGSSPQNNTRTLKGSSNAGGTPRASASFIGQQGSKVTCSYFPKGCNPPDMAVAASRTRVLQGVNTQWEVLDTSGNVQPGWPASAQAFFGVPLNKCDPDAGGQPFLSDPRALYDPSTGRFWAAMLQLEGALGVGGACDLKTVYYIAVSRTHDPSGSWNVYEFDMSLGTTNVADFTQIGFDRHAVYFSANVFNQEGSAYEYAEIFEANKSEMEAGGAAFTATGFFNLQAHGPGGDFLADTVQPVLNLDGGGAGLFVDTFDGPDPISGNFCSSPTDACRGLAVWRMSNPTAHDHGGPAPRLTGSRVDTQPFTFPFPADQPSCLHCIDSSDLRISATPVQRDGIVYAAWETGIGESLAPGIEWAQFSVEDGQHPGGSRSGYYVPPSGAHVIYPALMPGEDGSLTMLFDRMSSTINPETRFIVRPDGASQFSGEGRLLKAGEASYRPTLCGTAIPVCRWGDYSATTFDGGNRIWFAGQYANSFTDPNAPPVFGRNWGTWIGAIKTDQGNNR